VHSAVLCWPVVYTVEKSDFGNSRPPHGEHKFQFTMFQVCDHNAVQSGPRVQFTDTLSLLTTARPLTGEQLLLRQFNWVLRESSACVRIVYLWEQDTELVSNVSNRNLLSINNCKTIHITDLMQAVGLLCCPIDRLISQLIKKLPAFFLEPKVHYRLHKSAQLDSVPSQKNPIHTSHPRAAF
jgi:hypothetical protein